MDIEVPDEEVHTTENVTPVIEKREKAHPNFLPTSNKFSSTRYYEQLSTSHISTIKDPIFVRPIFPSTEVSYSPNEIKQITIEEETPLQTYKGTSNQLTFTQQGLQEKKSETSKSTPKVPRLVLDQLLNCLGDKNDKVATARNVTYNNNTKLQFKNLETSNHYNLATLRNHHKNSKDIVSLNEKVTKKTPSIMIEKPACFAKANHVSNVKLQKQFFTSPETKTTEKKIDFNTNYSNKPPNSIPQGNLSKDSRQSFLEKYYAKQSASTSTTSPSPCKPSTKHNLFSFSSLKKTALTSKKCITRKLERLV
jgi:hypothetical protein